MSLSIMTRVLCACSSSLAAALTHATRAGGGVLAYTLLGVARSDSGVRFLILDPHYTGADELKTVVSKRWCAWHGPDLFRADAHYNLCMPRVPDAI